MEKDKIKREGYVVITPTLCQGDTMSWSTEDDKGKTIPDVYDTADEAWKEVADSMITELKQFIDGERELNETNFGTEEYVALYQEFEDGTIVISDDEGNPIIETTLKKWRANL